MKVESANYSRGGEQRQAQKVQRISQSLPSHTSDTSITSVRISNFSNKGSDLNMKTLLVPSRLVFREAELETEFGVPDTSERSKPVKRIG